LERNLPMRVLGWILTIISCSVLGVILFLGRDSVMTVTMLLFRNAYLPRFIDKIYLVMLGLVWLVSWFFVEGYYSNGVKRRRLWPRFLQVTGAELVLLFVSMILSLVYATTGTNWPGVALVTVALIAGVALILYANRLKSAPRVDSHTHSAGL
jgi:hypothetical protein